MVLFVNCSVLGQADGSKLKRTAVIQCVTLAKESKNKCTFFGARIFFPRQFRKSLASTIDQYVNVKQGNLQIGDWLYALIIAVWKRRPGAARGNGGNGGNEPTRWCASSRIFCLSALVGNTLCAPSLLTFRYYLLDVIFM